MRLPCRKRARSEPRRASSSAQGERAASDGERSSGRGVNRNDADRLISYGSPVRVDVTARISASTLPSSRRRDPFADARSTTSVYATSKSHTTRAHAAGSDVWRMLPSGEEEYLAALRAGSDAISSDSQAPAGTCCSKRRPLRVGARLPRELFEEKYVVLTRTRSRCGRRTSVVLRRATIGAPNKPILERYVAGDRRFRRGGRAR